MKKDYKLGIPIRHMNSKKHENPDTRVSSDGIEGSDVVLRCFKNKGVTIEYHTTVTSQQIHCIHTSIL